MKKRLFVSLFTFIPLFLMTTACGGNPNSGESQFKTGTIDEHTSSLEENTIESEIGLTYTHTKTEIEWASEEIKNTQLDEMEIDEETFFNMYDSAKIEIKFLEENKATVIFNMAGSGDVTNVFYKNEKQVISFYDSLEDMEANQAKKDGGFFAGQFKLSDDYRTLYWMAHQEGILTITLTCTIK